MPPTPGAPIIPAPLPTMLPRKSEEAVTALSHFPGSAPPPPPGCPPGPEPAPAPAPPGPPLPPDPPGPVPAPAPPPVPEPPWPPAASPPPPPPPHFPLIRLARSLRPPPPQFPSRPGHRLHPPRPPPRRCRNRGRFRCQFPLQIHYRRPRQTLRHRLPVRRNHRLPYLRRHQFRRPRLQARIRSHLPTPRHRRSRYPNHPLSRRCHQTRYPYQVHRRRSLIRLQRPINSRAGLQCRTLPHRLRCPYRLRPSLHRRELRSILRRPDQILALCRRPRHRRRNARFPRRESFAAFCWGLRRSP